MKITRQIVMSIILSGMCVWMSGCGDKTNTYFLEGAITYQGKPVVGGVIDFTPDSEQGNKGPGSKADIENGKYKTRPSRGIVGGPYVMTVYAVDGRIPKDMDDDTSAFPPYIIPVELPKGGVFDIAIPSEGGRFEKVNKTGTF